MKMTGKNRSTRGKTNPSATLSSTHPTWTDPGSSPGLRYERPATNRLSHGTALYRVWQNIHESHPFTLIILQSKNFIIQYLVLAKQITNLVNNLEPKYFFVSIRETARKIQLC
jgi:hypothetical protein